MVTFSHEQGILRQNCCEYWWVCIRPRYWAAPSATHMGVHNLHTLQLAAFIDVGEYGFLWWRKNVVPTVWTTPGLILEIKVLWLDLYSVLLCWGVNVNYIIIWLYQDILSCLKLHHLVLYLPMYYVHIPHVSLPFWEIGLYMSSTSSFAFMVRDILDVMLFDQGWPMVILLKPTCLYVDHTPHICIHVNAVTRDLQDVLKDAEHFKMPTPT